MPLSTSQRCLFRWSVVVCAGFLSVVMTNPLEVSSVVSSTSSTGRTYCGTQLVEALKYVCVTFPSVFQRPVQKTSVHSEKERETLVDACCYRKCNLTYLKQYCEESKNVTLEVTTAPPVVKHAINVIEEVVTEAPAVPEVVFINADVGPLTMIPRYTSPHLGSYLYDHYETRAIL